MVVALVLLTSPAVADTPPAERPPHPGRRPSGRRPSGHSGHRRGGSQPVPARRRDLAGTSARTGLLDEAAETREQPVHPTPLALGWVLGAGAGLGHGPPHGAPGPDPGQVAGLGTGCSSAASSATTSAARSSVHAPTGAPSGFQAAQLAGTMGGTGLAPRGEHAQRRREPPPRPRDRAGWQTAAGISDLAGFDLVDDGQLRSGLALAGGLSFLGTAAAIGPRLDTPTAGTVGLAVADAAWLGAWTPWLCTDHPTDARIAGGFRLGLGAGTGPSRSPGRQAAVPRSLGLQAIGTSAGSVLGAGIPLALGNDEPLWAVVAPMLAVGAGGQLAGALVAPNYLVSDDDRFLLATLAAWTGYQTAGWTVYAERRSSPRRPRPPARVRADRGGRRDPADDGVSAARGEARDLVPAPREWRLGDVVRRVGQRARGFGRGRAVAPATLVGGDAAIVGTAVAGALGPNPPGRTSGT